MILIAARTTQPPPAEPLTASLTVNLTVTEKAAVRTAATTAGVSMSAWARQAVNARM